MSSAELLDATTYLTDEMVASKPKAQVENAVGVIRSVAKERGLEPDYIEPLMDFVTGVGGGTIPARIQILRCLVPKTTVPDQAVITGLGSMRSLPNSLRLLLFRWMVLVFDLLENRKRIQALYDVIFQYLAYDDLRPTVSQLLCYMTKRSHVREFRIQRLMELYKQVVVHRDSSESSFMVLLNTYKFYSPNLVPTIRPPGRKVLFRPFEKELAKNIVRIQNKRPRTVGGSSKNATTADHVHTYIYSAPPPPKKRRRNAASSIPSSAPSSRFSSSSSRSSEEKCPAVSITSIQELCDNIHQLELPGRMGAVLESSLLQHVLSLWPDPSASLRLTYWLQSSLGIELDNYTPGEPQSQHLENMLKCLVKLTQFLQESNQTVEVFLSILLETWNGEDYQTDILKLISYCSLQEFDDLECHYLEPLKQLFVKRDVHFKCAIVSTLTQLLSFWALMEWPRHQKKAEASFQGSGYSKLNVFAESVWNEEDPDDLDPGSSARLLVLYTERLCRIAMEIERSHALIQHASTSFYELVTRLPEDYGIPLLHVPHPQIVNQTLLSTDPTSLSRLLSCCISCKSVFSKIEKEQRDMATISIFNSVVLDMCDSLWRNLAFSVSTTRPYPSHLFTIDKEHFKRCGVHSVSNKLSIIHHPALLGFVKEFFRETQGTSYNEFQPSSIWKEQRFKKAYLDYLSSKHLTGLSDFIRTFILIKNH